MNKLGPIVFLSLLAAVAVTAQDANRYMVFLKDKEGTAYSISQPGLFLSNASLARRAKQGIPVTVTDLPVNPAYLEEIFFETGAQVIFKTKWMNGVLVEATPDQRAVIGNLSFVDRVEFVAWGKTGSTGRKRTDSKLLVTSSLQDSQNQNSILALDEMHRDGITGNGITIAILDTGFPGIHTNPAFSAVVADARIIDAYNFSLANANAFTGDKHGAQVFSIIAATLPQFSGGAFDANYLLYATEFVPTEYRVEEYNWLFAAERADSAGADIISTSLGYTEFDDPTMNYKASDLDGKTAIISKAAALAFEKGMVVVAAAGNFGATTWRLISPPADVENVIAVGSINADLQRSSFSSYGPTADGRIKPDVMAIGGSAATVLPGGSINFSNGTSFACPMVTSLVAGVMQKWPNLNAGEIADLIRQSGSRSFNPDNTYGYGIPSYRAIKNKIEFPSTGSDGIFIYPIPVTDGKLMVAISPTDATITSVKLFSVLGQPIAGASYEAIWNLNPFILDVSGLAPGLYFMQIDNKGTQKTLRVIKQ